MSPAHVVAADPFIDWAALGKVSAVSLLFGIAVVVLFSVGVVGLSMARGKADGDAPVPSSTRAAGSVLASLCFLLCAAAVGYGLYLIIPQFH